MPSLTFHTALVAALIFLSSQVPSCHALPRPSPAASHEWHKDGPEALPADAGAFPPGIGVSFCRNFLSACQSHLSHLSSNPDSSYSTDTCPYPIDYTANSLLPNHTGCQVYGSDDDWAQCVWECCDVTLEIGIGIQEFPPTARAKLSGIWNPVVGEWQKRKVKV